MNKKGFTTVELILTLAIVIVIMGTITGVTFSYRDESALEQTITEVKDYKNTVTKIIYDDILDIRGTTDEPKGKVVKISKSETNNNKYILTTELGINYNLEIINEPNKVGLRYGEENQEIEYIIPGSDTIVKNNKNNTEEKLVYFEDEVRLEPTDESDSDVYSLDIYFKHKRLSDKIKIHLVVLR